jgi:N-acetyltransferase
MMIPPMQPNLSDDRVLLRPMVDADREALFAAASDPAIWAIHPSPNRWREPVFAQYFDEGLTSGGMMLVSDAMTGSVIGSSRYDSDNAEAGQIEIGWSFLVRTHWGGQYNRAVKRLMLAHAFAAGYDSAIFLVGTENLRSRRAMEKIGGVLNNRRTSVVREGKTIEHVIYAIARADFANGPLSQ